MKFYVETGVGCNIIEAKNAEAARKAALREVGTEAGVQVVRKATKEDLAWDSAMQGGKLNEYQTFQSGPRKDQPKTLTDRVVRFLVEGLIFQEIDSRSRYRHFLGFSIHGGARYNYWIGKNGAVRAGKSASDSISLTDQVHANMKMWEAKR